MPTTPSRILETTHESGDTDSSAWAVHHTLGPGPNQAARGNHTHNGTSSGGGGTGPPGPPGQDGTDGQDGISTAYYAEAIGNLGPSAELVVNHGLGNLFVDATFKVNATEKSIEFDWRVINENQIGVKSDKSFTAGTIDILVLSPGIPAGGGTSGTLILNGVGPPSSGLGAVDNYYLDTLNHVLYGPKLASSLGPAESALPDSPVPDQRAAGEYCLGNRFKAIVGGTVTGARFWRDQADTYNFRAVTMWTDVGGLIGTSAGSNEAVGAPSGWESVVFSPVPLASNQTFVISTDFHAFGWSSRSGPDTNPAHMTHLDAVYSTTHATFPTNIQPGINRYVTPIWQPNLGTVWPVALVSETGGGGAGISFEQTFASASATWVVTHNLNSKYIEVNVFSLDGLTQYEPEIVYDSLNQCTIKWAYPTTGIVRILG